MVNIVICDDQIEYQEIAEHKIRQCMYKNFDMECSITCYNNLDRLKNHIDSNKVDIIFLDIMINDENAMNWSIENINNHYTQLIFMTSYPQCAYNISETNACYYMVKSLMTDEVVYKALKRALQNTTKKDPNLTIVKSGAKNHVVNFQDILYIESLNNNIVIHIKNKNNITIYSTLKEYSQCVPPNFLRCHKSYMVNMNHITGYEPHKFIIGSDKEIPIPPKKYNSIIDTYKNYLRNI